MKWIEAYRCKICGKIHLHRRDRYCKRCGTEITCCKPSLLRFTPTQTFATDNLEPVVVRRVIFGWEVRPGNIPKWIIQGTTPPRPSIEESEK